MSPKTNSGVTVRHSGRPEANCVECGLSMMDGLCFYICGDNIVLQGTPCCFESNAIVKCFRNHFTKLIVSLRPFQ